ncbi:MAG: hypothetical protein GVY15_09645 [Bacteroidetes bacterium]|nr:hypothetical protein [Bacteroidota bacterium]
MRLLLAGQYPADGVQQFMHNNATDTDTEQDPSVYSIGHAALGSAAQGIRWEAVRSKATEPMNSTPAIGAFQVKMGRSVKRLFASGLILLLFA